MDTIKSYLETMFANLPATAEVLKAKDELWGMMEDKYNELISEGKSENEAVGTVISEFGNLDELAETIKTLKWLFIEQDIRYWNYSGRDMLWKGIHNINHII